MPDPHVTRAVTLMTLLSLGACSETERPRSAQQTVPEPSADCAELWTSPDAVALLDTLSLATSSSEESWDGYSPASSSYVLHAGASADGGECLGLFQSGEAVSYATLDVTPDLRTPLYGYFFAYDAQGGAMPALAESSKQPEAVEQWLLAEGVRSAVVVPVTPRDFPMALPAIAKAQIAIHEAFHIDVQGPTWMGHDSPWPEWDAQPDLAEVAACYTASPSVEAAFTREREALLDVIRAQLDGDVLLACGRANDFLTERSGRMRLLEGSGVTMANGETGSCAEGEAFAELEEGIADYASWGYLFDRGIATRAQLERRYSASQAATYYLTGAMKMHAAALWTGTPAEEFRAVATSASISEGSPQARFELAFAGSCSPD